MGLYCQKSSQLVSCPMRVMEWQGNFIDTKYYFLDHQGKNGFEVAEAFVGKANFTKEESVD